MRFKTIMFIQFFLIQSVYIIFVELQEIEYEMEDYFDGSFSCSKYIDQGTNPRAPCIYSNNYIPTIGCAFCPIECAYCASFVYDVEVKIGSPLCMFYDLFRFVPHSIENENDVYCTRRNVCQSTPCKNGAKCVEVFYSYICICDNKKNYEKNCQNEVKSGWENKLASGIQVWYPHTVVSGFYFPILVTFADPGEEDNIRIELRARNNYQTVLLKQHKNKRCSEQPEICGCSFNACRSFYSANIFASTPVINEEFKHLPTLWSPISICIGWVDRFKLKVFHNKYPKPVYDEELLVFTRSNPSEIRHTTEENAFIFNCLPIISIDTDVCGPSLDNPPSLSGSTTHSFVFKDIRTRIDALKLVQSSHRGFANQNCKPEFLKYSWKFLLVDKVPSVNEYNEEVLSVFSSCHALPTGQSKCKVPKGSLRKGFYQVKGVATEDPSTHHKGYSFCYMHLESQGFFVTIIGPKKISTVPSKGVTIMVDGAGTGASGVLFKWKCTNLENSKKECPSHTSTDPIYVVEKDTLSPGKYNFTVVADNGHYTSSDWVEVVVVPEDDKTKHKEDIRIGCSRNCGDLKDPKEEITLYAFKPDRSEIKKELHWSYTVDGGNELPLDDILKEKRGSEVYLATEKMSEGKEYNISVRVDGNIVSSYTIKYVLDKPPTNGNCKVNPTEGIRGYDLFDVECTGWMNSKRTLVYEFFDKYPNDSLHYLGRMMGTSFTGKLSKFRMTRGILVVYIISMNGLSSNFSLNVKLTYMEDNVSHVNNLMQTLHEHLNTDMYSRAMRIASVVADILEPSMPLRVFLGNLITAVKVVPVENSADMKLFLSTIRLVLFRGTDKGKVKLNDRQDRIVGRILLTLADMYFSSVTDKYHTPKFTSDHSHQLSKLFLDTIDMTILARDENITLSPEEDVDFNVIKNLQHSSRDIGIALEFALYCISHYQYPAEIETEISSTESLSNMWSKVDNLTALSEIVSVGRNITSVKITPKLASYFNYKADMVLQYSTLTQNLFWWAEGHINTELILIGLGKRNPNLNSMFISVLTYPLHIYLKVKRMEKANINGTATQLDPNLDSETLDIKLMIHRIIPPPLSKLYIKFNFTQQKTSLRVLVGVNKRPDWSMMMQSAVIINETNPLFDVPYYRFDREDFFYMGILPALDVVVGSSVGYEFELYYVLCQIWKSQWSNHFCFVGNKTSEISVECHCTHLSIFASAIAVPPNDINPFADAKLFLTVLDNPWVVVFVLLILLMFLLFLLWAALKDRKDRLSRDVIVLDDNFPGESYGYLLAVHTGARFTSGSSANVGIRLYGDQYASRPHILRSSKRKVLRRDNDDWFLLCYPTSLGTLNSVQLWHDNTGRNPDWFCSKVIVYDLFAKTQYIFLIEQWLALEVDDFPEAVVRPATVDEILNIKRLFLDNSIFGFRENHTWLSVFVRHPRSSVSRKERLTVLMVCIMTAMLASIMFFKVSDDYEYFFFLLIRFTFLANWSKSPEEIDEPSYSVGLKEIIVSIQSFIVSTICTIAVLFLFRQSYKQKPVGHKSTLYAPTRRSISDPSHYWFSDSSSYIDLSDMKAYNEKPKKERKDMTVYESIIKAIKKMAVSKKLQPVRLTNETSTIRINKTWLIAAWFFSIVTILVCAYLVMLYSLKFGQVKSMKWLSSLVMTMAEDILILSPIKIVLMAVVLSIAFERIIDASSFLLNIKDAIKFHLVGDNDYLEDLCEKRKHPMYYPISKIKKQVMREKRIRIMKWRTLLDFVMVLLFILVLCLVMNNMWSGAHYIPNYHATELLSNPQEPDSINFHQVYNRTQFNQYLDSTFVSALYSFRWFNMIIMPKLTPEGDEFRRKDWTGDFISRMMGVPRLRQLRVIPGKCQLSKMFTFYGRNCILPWKESNMDNDVYGVSWFRAQWEDQLRHEQFWKYTEPWNSSVFSLPGKSGTVYPSGGYIVELGATRKDSVRILADIRETGWQDVHTRVTFVELTLYNVNSHLFSQVTLVVEHMPYGEFLVVSNADSVHIREELSVWNMTYLIFIFILFVRIAYKINRSGLLSYFSKFLNIYEIQVILLGTLSITVYLIHLNQSSYYVQEFQRRGLDRFFNFKEIIYYFRLTKICLWLLFCFAVFRLFISWHFGRSYFSFYYSFVLSRPWIIILTLLFLLYFFILWRLCGYVILAMVFPNYQIPIVQTNSYHFLKKENIATRVESVLLLLMFSALLFKAFTFVLFTYYYKIGKDYRINFEDNFNFITFIGQEIKTLFRKRDKKIKKKKKEPVN